MNKYLLLSLLLSFALLSCKRQPADEPLIHATYSVLSRIVPEELNVDQLKNYSHYYLQAMPDWETEEFDAPLEDILRDKVEHHRYRKQDVLDTYIRTIHEAGNQVYLSFSGSAFIEVAEDPEIRHKFGHWMAAIARHHGFDGVELDWEHTVTKELHLAMMQEIRTALDFYGEQDGRRYGLTTALNSEHNYSQEEADALSAVADWVNIMYYDMGGGWWGKQGTHNTPLPDIKSNYEANWSRFDPKKIHIGLASYGYYYEGILPGEPVPDGGRLHDHARDFFYPDLPGLLMDGWQEVWDEAAQCPYYFAPDSSAFVSVDNARSIAAKMAWVEQKGFGGIFWWEYHCDYIPSEGRHLLMDYIEQPDLPMFWTWMEEEEGRDMEKAFAHMEEAGLDAVMLHAPSVEAYERYIEIAHRHGIAVYAWVWTLKPPYETRAALLESHPDWFDVNRKGESLVDHKAYVNSYKFLCPAVPEVQDYLVDYVRSICAIDGIEGICLDYCRLVDCVLPISLSYIYGIVQDGEVLPEYDYGYHPLMIARFKEKYGYDPRTRRDPSRDSLWCRFRCDVVTEAANRMAHEAHAAGKKVTASPFATEQVSEFMVYQRFHDWDLDFVFPMVYTDFYRQDAQFAYDATVMNERDRNPRTRLFCGLDTELGGPAEAIIEKMDYAFWAGAQGISLYTSEGMESPALRRRFKAYADSMRTLRAEKGGWIPFEKKQTADMDPFTHEALMANVLNAIQRLVAGDPLHADTVNGMAPAVPDKVYPALDLGPFEPAEGTERLARYHVTDRASGRSFEVLFVQYGHVISGWDVRPLED
jgi:spore germination protein YaaH